MKAAENRGALAIVLLLVFGLSRWPGMMPENFSATYALVFCAGVYLRGPLGWWLPLALVLTTDLLLNVFVYRVALVNPYMLVNYAAFALIIGLGRRFSRRSSVAALLAGGIAGCVLFYLITNTAAWLHLPEYAKTLGGWLQALTVGTAGWPETWKFFRNTLLSGGLFTGIFVVAMKASERRQEEPKEERAPEGAPDANEPVEPVEG